MSRGITVAAVATAVSTLYRPRESAKSESCIPGSFMILTLSLFFFFSLPTLPHSLSLSFSAGKVDSLANDSIIFSYPLINGLVTSTRQVDHVRCPR